MWKWKNTFLGNFETFLKKLPIGNFLGYFWGKLLFWLIRKPKPRVFICIVSSGGLENSGYDIDVSNIGEVYKTLGEVCSQTPIFRVYSNSGATFRLIIYYNLHFYQ